MHSTLIYLASPYTFKCDSDVQRAAVMQHRHDLVAEALAVLMREGRNVYSPIKHCHGLHKFGLPTDWEYWEKVDGDMIRRVDELWVLTIDGWKESVGVTAEVKIAHSLAKPVHYWLPPGWTHEKPGAAGKLLCGSDHPAARFS